MTSIFAIQVMVLPKSAIGVNNEIDDRATGSSYSYIFIDKKNKIASPFVEMVALMLFEVTYL